MPSSKKIHRDKFNDSQSMFMPIVVSESGPFEVSQGSNSNCKSKILWSVIAHLCLHLSESSIHWHSVVGEDNFCNLHLLEQELPQWEEIIIMINSNDTTNTSGSWGRHRGERALTAYNSNYQDQQELFILSEVLDEPELEDPLNEINSVTLLAPCKRGQYACDQCDMVGRN